MSHYDPAKFTTATITGRVQLSEDLWRLHLKLDETVQFRYGQYITLGLYVGDELVERPYSIVSAPSESPNVELFLERVPHGELTVPLHVREVGSELYVRRKPKGLFLKNLTFDGTPRIFVATVTGVAPFLSILRSIQSVGFGSEDAQESPVLLLHGASHVDEFGYREELESLSSEMAWLTYIPTLSRPWDHSEWNGEVGRVDELLRKYTDALHVAKDNGQVFLCGHPGMISHATGIMQRRGLLATQIHEEQYWPE